MTQSQKNQRYLIVGAGLQSEAVADYLLGCPDTAGITFIDRDPQALSRVKKKFSRQRNRIAVSSKDAGSTDQMSELMSAHGTTVSAASYKLNVGLTRSAIATGTHLVDMGGNDGVVAEQFKLSDEAKAMGSRILPDCGVAPGAASILVRHALEKHLGHAKNVRIYCGGLPQNPAGPLKYAKFFAMSGLINEYKERCRIIKEGKLQYVRGLDRSDKSVIQFPILGELESAYTSGGVSTLVDTYAGKLDNLSYETLRYPGDPGQPGHWDIMRMYRDNGWFEDKWTKFHVNGVDMTPRAVLEAYLDQTLPREQPDYLALMVEAEAPGDRTVRLTVLDRMDEKKGLSAMQRTTGYTAGICARMLATGQVQEQGVLKHETHIPSAEFIAEWASLGIGVHATIWLPRTAQ